MNWNLFIIFVILNIVNVILQTIKSLCTINSSKMVAGLTNAVAYGIYTVVIVYTVCDLPLWLKCIVVAVANFVGVYISRAIFEKLQKDKIWKLEVTVKKQYAEELIKELQLSDVSFNYFDNIGKYYIFNIFSEDHKETEKIKGILTHYKSKIFISENRATF